MVLEQSSLETQPRGSSAAGWLGAAQARHAPHRAQHSTARPPQVLCVFLGNDRETGQAVRNVQEDFRKCCCVSLWTRKDISAARKAVFLPVHLNLEPEAGSVSSGGPVRASPPDCAEGNADPVG